MNAVWKCGTSTELGWPVWSEMKFKCAEAAVDSHDFMHQRGDDAPG
jgi:hypothetical protein